MTLPSALSIVVACAGVGAFVDFWIGKSGQKAIRDKLETWWLRLSYVNIHSFGRDEAIYSAHVIKYVFGSFFSIRRIVSVFVIGVTVVIMRTLVSLFLSHGHWMLIHLSPSVPDVFVFVIVTLLFSLSISLTIIGATAVAYTTTSYTGLNIVLFLSVLLIQYLILCIWPLVLFTFILIVEFGAQVAVYGNFTFEYVAGAASKVAAITIQALRDHWYVAISPYTVLNGIKIDMFDQPRPGFYVVSMILKSAENLLGVVVNLGRLLLAAIFTASFLFRPVWPYFSTLWLRVIESDKPVCTLLFSDIGAFAGAIQTLVKV